MPRPARTTVRAVSLETGSKVPSGSDPRQGAVGVGDEIRRVLDAEGNAHHARIDACGAELLVGEAVVGGVDREADQGLDAAEARGPGHEPQAVVEPLCR